MGVDAGLPALGAAERTPRGRRLREEADRWLVPGCSAVATAAFAVGGAAAVSAAASRPRLFRLLVAEDRIFEWAQVGCWTAAGAAAGLVAVRLAAGAGRRPAGAYALVALGCFFVAGEELSWGQRLLGIETPDGLAAVNEQAEITLHNLAGAEAFRLPFVLAGLFGSVGAVVLSFVRRRGLDLYAPPLFLAPLFFVAAAYGLVRLAFVDSPTYAFAKWSEFPELCLALGVVAFAVLQRRRLSLDFGRFSKD